GRDAALKRRSTLNPQLLNFLVVVLAVENVPLLGTFQDGTALALDLLPGGSIDARFLCQQVLQQPPHLQPDCVAVFEEIDIVHRGERVGDAVCQLVDLLAADSHREVIRCSRLFSTWQLALSDWHSLRTICIVPVPIAKCQKYAVQRTALYFLTSSFFTFLNISW